MVFHVQQVRYGLSDTCRSSSLVNYISREWPQTKVMELQSIKIKIGILGSEFLKSGTYANRAKQATEQTTPRLACVF
jgi:hypothetical protein